MTAATDPKRSPVVSDRGLVVALVTMLGACRERDAKISPDVSPPPPAADASQVTDLWAANPCLTDPWVLPKLREMEALADVGHAAVPSVLVTTSCKKRVYLHGQTKIVVWRRQDGKVVSNFSPAKAHPTTPACFERAVRRAETLVPYAKSLLAREARENETTWDDPDIGVATSVDCDADEQPSLESIHTLLHESNHQLSDGACLHEFTTDQPLCFQLDDKLPPRSIARIPESMRRLDKKSRVPFDVIQDTYLGVTDQGPDGLFDELMAYRITSEVFAAGLRIPGEIAPGTHSYNHLPLFMDLSVRYVTELSKRDPALAERAFGVTTDNRAHLLELLDRAEVSYKTWLDALAEAHRQPTAYEKTFWAAYQRDRRRWLAR